MSASAIAVSKENTDLLAEINTALTNVRQSGEYDRILETWRPTEVIFKTRAQVRRQQQQIAVISVLLLAALLSTLLLAREVRRRKRVKSALQESATKYRIVADYTYDWEYWLDPHGRFAYCSPSCERISGHTAAEILADPSLVTRLIHPDDRPLFEIHCQETLSTPTVREAEWRCIHPDGTIRWVAHVYQPMFDAAGLFSVSAPATETSPPVNRRNRPSGQAKS